MPCTGWGSAASLDDSGIRLLSFTSVLILLLLWERRSLQRQRMIPRRVRWSINFSLGAANALLLRLMFPAGLVGAALFASQHGLGIFNIVPLRGFASIGASLLLLDVTIYWQHRLFHALPWLWRIHRLHHADTELDVSTALRFHPVESALSLLLKAVAVVAFGMPPVGVLAFEIILNAAAMFNHANASLPNRWEHRVRWLVVTPDTHRLHHSTSRDEANANFGFCLSSWDRLLGTYRRRSEVLPPMPLRIGLPS